MFYATNEEIEQFAAEYCEMSNIKARDVSTNVLFDFGAVLCYNKFVSEREEKERRKKFLNEHKKISLFVKNDIFESLKTITDNPEEYITKVIENIVERGV